MNDPTTDRPELPKLVREYTDILSNHGQASAEAWAWRDCHEGDDELLGLADSLERLKRNFSRHAGDMKPAPSAPTPRPTNPPGWRTLPVEVCTDGTRLILVGDPPDEFEDPECVAHHCDSMGCGRSHILASFTLADYHQLGLAHLIAAADREREAQEAADRKPESIREAVLKRLGRTPDAVDQDR